MTDAVCKSFMCINNRRFSVASLNYFNIISVVVCSLFLNFFLFLLLAVEFNVQSAHTSFPFATLRNKIERPRDVYANRVLYMCAMFIGLPSLKLLSISIECIERRSIWMQYQK